VPVSLVGIAAAIGAGDKHTCATITGVGVKCWGNNNHGQLGDGTQTNRSSPVSVLVLGSNVVELAGGTEHTCALLAGGSVWCWGRNDVGQLGTGTKVDSSVPVAVLMAGTATAIAAGDKYTCAAVSGGGVDCWGQNSGGQLGDGTTTDHSLPAPVTGLTARVQSLSAGQQHTCASLVDGMVECWGKNDKGQLGDGTSVSSPTPVVALVQSVQSVTAGQDFTCAAELSGTIECWGTNTQGQLGTGSSQNTGAPAAVTPLPAGVSEISAGQSHACSLQFSGAVYCWGQNNHSQLGNGSNGGSRIPTKVLGLP
jgi:alpha-tubulin suppressor-like RCC1 family protein